MTAAAFLSILVIHLLAAISPGPSFAVTVRTAAAEGFRPAAAFALGLGLGAVVLGARRAHGPRAPLRVAPVALTALKLAGGLFLIWIAIATWRHADAPLPEAAPDALPRSLASGVRFGLLTQLANPKVAVFFGAVFVGLVPPGTGWPALALLLAVILLDETLWYLFVARVFSLARARAAYARAKAWVDRAFGGLIAAFGVKIAAA